MNSKSWLSVRGSWLIGPLLLLALVIIANFNICFLGESLVATANSNPLSGGRPLRTGTSHVIAPSANWHDVGGAWWQWEPAGKMLSRAFRNGRIPLWDSEVGGGVDSHVNMLQTQYYPPYILLLLAGDTPFQRDMYYLGEIYIAGLFTYLLFRNSGFGLLPALGAGALYMLSGAIAQTINSSFGQSLVVIPLMVWAVDFVLRRATWAAVATASMLLALATLSSFLPAVISGYILVGIFINVDLICRTLENRRRFGGWKFEWDRSIKALAAVLLALGLTAFLIWPVKLASQQDLFFAHWYQKIGLQHVSLVQMLTLVSPSVSFDVNQIGNPKLRLFQQAAGPSPFYAGLVTIVLACLAFGNHERRSRKMLLFFSASTAFFLLKLIGAPPVQWLGFLPMFRQLHMIPYFYGAFGFGIAGLAGIGIETVTRERGRTPVLIAAGSIAVILISVIGFIRTHPWNPVLTDVMLRSLLRSYTFHLMRLAALAALVLGVLAVRTRFSQRLWAAGALLSLAVLDLSSLGMRHRYLRTDVWDQPPSYVRFLQTDRTKFRVVSMYDTLLPADVSQAEGIDVLSSRMAFHSPRYSELIHRFFNAPALPYPIVQDLLPASRVLLDVLNVKYLAVVAGTVPQSPTLAGFAPVFQGGRVLVLENQSCWPRAYLANAVKVVKTPAEALDSLVALRAGDAALEEPLEPSFGGGGIDELRYDFDQIDIRVHTDAGGLLVLGENNQPGWSATVNGQRSHIYNANYVSQAVKVPSGRSDVHFSYFPPGLFAGLWVSLCSLGIVFALWFGSLARLGTPSSNFND